MFAELYGLEPDMETMCAIFTFIFLGTAFVATTAYLGVGF